MKIKFALDGIGCCHRGKDKELKTPRICLFFVQFKYILFTFNIPTAIYFASAETKTAEEQYIFSRWPLKHQESLQ